MKKDKYYKIKDFENVHIIIGQKGYGKTYYEAQKLIKSKLLQDKRCFKNIRNHLVQMKLLDCDDYVKYDILISYIDDLLNYLDNNK